MSYADEAYYNSSFHGEPVDPADFPDLLERAEEIVEEMTMYRLTQTAFEQMSESMRDRVKRAVCAQIEYLDANGGSDLDSGADIQSAGLGKYNYSRTTGADGTSQQSIQSPRAIRILAPTGLMYRGGGLL